MAKAKKPGEKQVTAWLYMVITPVLNGLNQELYFLTQRKSPTWRLRPKRCDFMRPIQGYIDISQFPTLSQFHRYYPKIEALAKAHDDALERLEASAETAHAKLAAIPELRVLAERIDTEFKDWRGTLDGPELLAEEAINHAHSPPPGNYTDAPAWEKYRPQVLALLDHASVAGSFATLNSAREDLAGRTLQLSKKLAELRDELADDFGLPPALPVTSFRTSGPSRERF